MKIFNSSTIEKFKKTFTKTRESISDKLKNIFHKESLSEEDLDNLENILIQSDFGVDFTEKLIENLRSNKIRNQFNEHSFNELVKTEFMKYFPDNEISIESNKRLVIQIVGINGSGKTTTIAKLANYYKNLNKKVLIASCDTFRAAANEQLKTWAVKADVSIVEDFSRDSAAVAFEALKIFSKNNYDVLLIDTAGRLHTNTNLMNELKKISSVITENGSSDLQFETFLVVDGNSGQNAKNQLKEFLKYIPITGLIITKLDGTAKGGAVLQLAIEKNIKVRFVGLGEQIDDLSDFDADIYISAILNKFT